MTTDERDALDLRIVRRVLDRLLSGAPVNDVELADALDRVEQLMTAQELLTVYTREVVPAL